MSDLDAKKPSRRLWVIAALCAVALHGAGVALAVVQMQAEDDGNGLGANAIEVGLEMTSPQLDATDLPPGPDSEVSVASPAVAEQKAEVKETDLPKAEVIESETPDRIVTETESKKPTEEEKEKAVVQQTASTESVAAEATARQSIEGAREGENSAAPKLGIGKDDLGLIAKWKNQLSPYLELHKRYPKVNNPRSVKVKVNFTIDRVGHVLSVSVAEGSGDPTYDEAALAMVRRSDPLPKPPPAIADEGLNFNVDVIFNARKS